MKIQLLALLLFSNTALALNFTEFKGAQGERLLCPGNVTPLIDVALGDLGIVSISNAVFTHVYEIKLSDGRFVSVPKAIGCIYITR